MKPIKFKGHNKVYAEHQEEYIPLPVFEYDSENGGEVVHCWKLTFKERVKILFTGILWINVLNFHKPLQPILPTLIKPPMLTPTQSDN